MAASISSFERNQQAASVPPKADQPTKVS